MNKRLPGWQDPPSREDIQAALKAYDEDGNGTLDHKEFEKFARWVVGVYRVGGHLLLCGWARVDMGGRIRSLYEGCVLWNEGMWQEVG